MGLPLSVTTGILLVSHTTTRRKWENGGPVLSYYPFIQNLSLSLSHTHTLNYTFSSHSTKNFVVFLRAWHKKNSQD